MNFGYKDNYDEPIFKIIEKIVPDIIKKKQTITFGEYPENYDFINDFFYRSFSLKDKFSIYQEFLNNPFINIAKKKELEAYFYKAQRVFWAFKNAYHLKKVKKTNSKIDIDLYHNNLNSQNEKFLIKLDCGGVVYVFNIFDLLKVINNGLIYCPDFFSEPKFPTNPWTNIPLSECNLYNIYFHLVKHNILIPQLFYSFFRSGWNIYKFLCKNEAYLRDLAIENYYDDLTDETKYNDIVIMMRRFRRFIPALVLDPRFPSQKVIEKFEYLLKDDLISEYSYNPTNRINARNYIKRNLKEFVKTNPKFGRVIIKSKKNNTFFDKNIRDESIHIIYFGEQKEKYKFYNLLSNQIPNFTSIEDIFTFISNDEFEEDSS